jgi:hypothetical protein
MQYSFFDSGSNGLFFNDPAVFMGSCGRGASGFYCPDSSMHLLASVALATSSTTIPFTIDNATQLFASGNSVAFSNLGGPTSDSYFDWGLPFFFGRTVFTVIEGSRVNSVAGNATGPLYAFTH